MPFLCRALYTEVGGTQVNTGIMYLCIFSEGNEKVKLTQFLSSDMILSLLDKR